LSKIYYLNEYYKDTNKLFKKYNLRMYQTGFV